MFNIGGIQPFQQFGIFNTHNIQTRPVNQVLNMAAQNIVGFGGSQVDNIQFGNGALSGGWSLNLPVFDYQMTNAQEYSFLAESDGQLQTRDQIVMDWDGDGKILTKGRTDEAERVSFDVDGDGVVDRAEWTTGDAFLAYDVNGDGDINDGTELMNTTGIDGEQGKYANGWQKVSALFDENQDGMIAGDELDKLSIWADGNADGVTDDGELISAQDAGVQSIDTRTGSVVRASLTEDLSLNSGERITAGGFDQPYYFPTFTQEGGTNYFGRPMTRFDIHGGEWNVPSNYWMNPAFM